MGSNQHRVLLAGASGYIGRAVAAKLLADGYEVIAPLRRPDQAPPGCRVIPTELDDRDKLSSALAGISASTIISCIASRSGVAEDAWRVDYQANRNLLQVASALGTNQFVLLSAICVQRPKLAFQQAKLAFEADLRASGLTYSIVRPTAFFRSLSGQVPRVQQGKPYLLFGDGSLTACKPIAEDDLAAFIVQCLADEDKQNRVLPIGGPGPALTPREQGEMLFELTGQTPRFKRVPPALFSVALSLLNPLSKIIPALAAKAELARIGRYYATESMLLWDEDRARYDESATPSTGKITLRDHYERVLTEGMAGQEAGDQKLF
ncbi:MAG: NAD(P)H-binding protein [Pseudomonadota bacterium]